MCFSRCSLLRLMLCFTHHCVYMGVCVCVLCACLYALVQQLLVKLAGSFRWTANAMNTPHSESKSNDCYNGMTFDHKNRIFHDGHSRSLARSQLGNGAGCEWTNSAIATCYGRCERRDGVREDGDIFIAIK